MENKMFIKKYSLGDFFEGIFKLVAKLFRFSIPVTFLLFLPVMILQLYIFSGMFNNISIFMDNIINNADFSNFTNFIPFLKICLLTVIYLVVYGIVFTLAYTYNTYIAFKAIDGKEIKIFNGFLTVIKKAFKIILNTLLQSLIIFNVIMIFLVIVVVLILLIIPDIMLLRVSSIVLLVLFYVFFICFFIWISNVFTLSPQAIVYDNYSIITSLGKSFSLIKKNWWRYCLISLLIMITLSFAFSTIFSPLFFIFVFPHYMDMIKTFLNGSYNSANFLEIFNYFFKIKYVFVAITFIQVLGYLLIIPSFKSLFYIDLKVRKGELTDSKDSVTIINVEDKTKEVQ